MHRSLLYEDMESSENTQGTEPFQKAAATMAEVHADGMHQVPHTQLGIERLIRTVGRPSLAYFIIALVAVWVLSDAFLAYVTHRPFDTLGLSWLQGLLTLCSLIMAVLILVVGNRQGEIADKRAQVTLQFTLVTEQKIAKVIELLETMRRDDPLLPNRRDDQAEAMARATDVRVAVDQLEQSKEEVMRARDLPLLH